MRFTPDNHYIMGLWLAARDDKGLPRMDAAIFARDTRVNKNVCLQFRTSDGSCRFAYAGSVVENLLNENLLGTPVNNIYSDRELADLDRMQAIKFSHPLIIHSLSSITTLAGDKIQVEKLQVPFICAATDEIIYVIGAFVVGQPISDADRAGMKDRKLKSRTVYDLETLKPIDHELTFPAPQGKTSAKPVSRAAE